MEQFDLNQIRTFVKLVQAGSFTKAAEVLKQPKSRVSRRLSALEKDLGVQLIYRTTRQFQLTEMGRVYYERARGLIEGLETLSGEVSESTSEISGVIKVTASDDMGVKQLPLILDEFTRQYPRVRFDLYLTQAYVDLVKESVDVGIRIGNLKDSSLKARKIGTVRSVLIASPGFLERYRVSEDLEKLSTAPYLAMTQNPKLEVVRATDSKRLVLKINPVLSANNPAMLLKMAVLGKGYAFIPEFLCKEELRDGRLVHIHKNLRSDEVPVSLVSPDTKETSQKVKRFMDFAFKRLKEEYFG
ncbi:LysR family transcriptional regulator [Bdellovibrio bacteriovorus]|uniref:LysR family transcriptional regulator n=1 Tax=Bdellovibrio bacteriovorus TaxID=959 RepID=UPI0021D0E155|nr:LysR family transcriptional regulator [Bdellovibrio bacteriovorus]UXR65230.1 LysR family transcriptional regulator [Bdellovibrio bacteriovorus]